MLDLDRALSDIKAMRSQVARGTEFRGYGPAAFATTGLLALFAAFVQARMTSDPVRELALYLTLWIATALACAAIIGIDVVLRSRRVHAGLADDMIQSAAEQLLPAGVAGALLTFVIVRFAPQSVWMLPGLWQIVLSLGAFAAGRLLPAPLMAVAFWYLGSGLACFMLAQDVSALSPWAMGLPFGLGQLLAAVLIHFIGAGDGDE